MVSWYPPQAYGELAAMSSEVLITAEAMQQHGARAGPGHLARLCRARPAAGGRAQGRGVFHGRSAARITIPVEVDFMAVSSYSPEARNKGLVRLVKDLEMPLTGRHVLFVEDVIDTGLTLGYLLRTLQARGPASLEVCVLFNKPSTA